VSRKDLSRTVIEGGRGYYNHFERDHSHRIERVTTRAWLDSVANDIDEADATLPPRRPPVHKQFHDKLGPATRWLASRVGRPWDKVYSELCSTFDRRSLAGMHVVDAHMVGEVRRHPMTELDAHYRWFDFYVDGGGILRRSPVTRHQWRRRMRTLGAWTRGCRAALTYRGWWWLRATTTPDRRTTFSWDRPLTKGDRRRLARLPQVLAITVTMRSPF
jgi:hypothetical protein